VPNDDLLQVMEYYGFSVDKAKSALKILSESELKIIKNTLMKGGLKK
jgi:ribosomal protein L10